MSDGATPYPAITELVPHGPPMLALEELVDHAPGRAVARMTVRPDALMVRTEADGRRVVPAVATLEYMAQAVAACLGHEAYRAGGGVRVGMVIACKRLDLVRETIAVGEELVVRVEQVRGNDHVSHFDGAVEGADGAAIASATLTLVHGERPPA